nr:response regulator [Sulfurimonas sp. SAG-AH-194-C21]
MSSVSSHETLSYLKKHKIDLLIQDVIRPEMGGIEFLRTLRSMPRFETLPSIFLTDMNLDEDFIKIATDLGALSLAKPMQKAAIVSTVLKLFPEIDKQKDF